MSELVPKGADAVADWIEVQLLRMGQAMGADALRSVAAEHGVGSTNLDIGLRNMRRRSDLLGEAYPFKVGGGAAAVSNALNTPWVAMLLASPGVPTRTRIDLATAAVMFERVVGLAVQQYFGPTTEVLRFAWPSEDGRPIEFPDAIKWLAARMKVPVGISYRPPYRRDGGVDVVGWRPFPDGRSGFPVILVQCTLEQSYVHKAGDIDLRVWAGWLRLDVDPVTALAVPGIVPSGEQWNQLAARAVILDRIRLAGLIGAPATFPGWIREWATATLMLLDGVG